MSLLWINLKKVWQKWDFLGTSVSVIKFSINTMKYHSVIVKLNTFVGVNPGLVLKKMCFSELNLLNSKPYNNTTSTQPELRYYYHETWRL